MERGKSEKPTTIKIKKIFEKLSTEDIHEFLNLLAEILECVNNLIIEFNYDPKNKYSDLDKDINSICNKIYSLKKNGDTNFPQILEFFPKAIRFFLRNSLQPNSEAISRTNNQLNPLSRHSVTIDYEPTTTTSERRLGIPGKLYAPGQYKGGLLDQMSVLGVGWPGESFIKIFEYITFSPMEVRVKLKNEEMVIRINLDTVLSNWGNNPSQYPVFYRFGLPRGELTGEILTTKNGTKFVILHVIIPLEMMKKGYKGQTDIKIVDPKAVIIPFALKKLIEGTTLATAPEDIEEGSGLTYKNAKLTPPQSPEIQPPKAEFIQISNQVRGLLVS